MIMDEGVFFSSDTSLNFMNASLIITPEQQGPILLFVYFISHLHISTFVLRAPDRNPNFPKERNGLCVLMQAKTLLITHTFVKLRWRR